MNHPGDLLSAYLDGELTPAEVRSIVGHLVECADCGRELNEINEARAALRSLPMLEVPEPGHGRHPVTRGRHRRLTRIAAVAAAVATLVVGVGLARGTPTGDPVDLVSVVEQHTARVSVDPGLPSLRSVMLVSDP